MTLNGGTVWYAAGGVVQDIYPATTQVWCNPGNYELIMSMRLSQPGTDYYAPNRTISVVASKR